MWRALQAQGIFRGAGPAAKVAFLYTGQGSQYVNMLAELRRREPIVAATFDEADAVMTPLLGKPLSEFVFAPEGDAERMAVAEEDLRRTAITQPAVLTVDIALTRLLAAQGVEPDFVMGHSLGEYGALVAAGSLSFAQALEAVSARGREMTKLSVGDPGKMVAVFAPLAAIEETLASVSGYAVIANVNSTGQAVVGGASDAVERAAAALSERGFECRFLPVSHAFHTRIVAPASEPLKALLGRLDLSPPRVPIVSNATGDFYPGGEGVVPAMIDLLARQIAEPVQFVRGLETLYAAGARVFVEIGPKRALQGFVADVLGPRRDILSLHTNHPKSGDVASVNHALCGLWASGRGAARSVAAPIDSASNAAVAPTLTLPAAAPAPQPVTPVSAPGFAREPGTIQELGHLFADFLERGFEAYRRGGGASPPRQRPSPRVVVTGAAVGLPGTEKRLRRRQPRPAARRRPAHPAGARAAAPRDGREADHPPGQERRGRRPALRGHRLDRRRHPARRARRRLRPHPRFRRCPPTAWRPATASRCSRSAPASTRCATPACRSCCATRRPPPVAGCPTAGRCPRRSATTTGVIFGSAFPGYDQLLGQVEAFHLDRARRERAAELRAAARRRRPAPLATDLDRRLAEIEAEVAREPYAFDRRFLFQVLAMGHSQFAEAIGARGPNVQINSACATTTQAFAIASDWIRTGRCRRVVVIAADDITSDHMLGWFGAGFLASGAAATDARVEDAALPFDRRRHGLLIGMGAAAVVLESAEAAARPRPGADLRGARHGHRQQRLPRQPARRRPHRPGDGEPGRRRRGALGNRPRRRSRASWSSSRTRPTRPARGGSAQAEVDALRRVFGADADRVVIANTKGYTGHPMGVGIEDVLAVKALETGLVPPVPNLREIDPDLGELHLSRGGAHPIRYALRLGAGFGSQISMTLLRWVPTADGRRLPPAALGYGYRVVDPPVWSAWLARAAGEASPRLEVVARTLRVADSGAGARAAATSPQLAAPVPPAPAAAQAPALAAAVATAPGLDPVQERVLALVAEKTGYPPEMLALDLDLEADLGVDTVKQAEVFAAIRAAWGIERDPDLKLRDFNTLAKTIEFVYAHRPELRAGAAPEAPSAPQPAAVATPTSAAPTAALPALADEVTEVVLALVAEKTGYPPEMLALDLDLEADLGVDTVKQAELFAAVRERYAIARDPDLKLRDFNTLEKTIGFVYDRRPDLRPGAATPAPAREPEPAAAGGTQVPAAGDALRRRVPALVLRPPLDFALPTGVTLAARDRVVVGCDRGSVAAALGHALAARGVETLALDPALPAAAIESRLAGWLGEGPIRGLYWLPALDPMPDLPALDLPGWREALRQRVKLLAVALRALDAQLAADGAFVVAGTRLGGGHGADEIGAAEVGGGGVSGLVKSFAREHETLLAKVVDFDSAAAPDAVAGALLLETEIDPGAVEIGHRGGERLALALVEAEDDGAAAGLELGPESVVVVTGAAGGIVSAIVADLARAGGSFHLLDLVPRPEPGDPDITRVR